MTKLRANRRAMRLSNLQTTIDPTTGERLAGIRSTYGSMVGRQVADSIIVRRAVALLSDHLAALQGVASVNAELTALLLVR